MERLTRLRHDIRSPLTAIKLLAKELENESHRDLLLSAVSRIEEISEDANRNCLGEIHAAELREGLRRLVQEKRVEHKRQIDFRFLAKSHNLTARRLPVNRTELFRSLSNLVNNAIEASKPGTAIHLCLSLSGDGVRVTVSDRGAGIDPKLIPMLLEPGQSCKENGNGLGLPYAKKAIEAMGGEFHIESQPQRGTAIHFDLGWAGAAH